MTGYFAISIERETCGGKGRIAGEDTLYNFCWIGQFRPAWYFAGLQTHSVYGCQKNQRRAGKKNFAPTQNKVRRFWKEDRVPRHDRKEPSKCGDKGGGKTVAEKSRASSQILGQNSCG